MTLDELIDIANAAYPDNLIRRYHDDPSAELGDGLAQFIASELEGTFDATEVSDQLRDAAYTIQNAIDQLQAVVDALETELTTETAHKTRGEAK